MTRGWCGGVDTSALAVRALSCAILLLVIGALGPKRQRAAPDVAEAAAQALVPREGGIAPACSAESDGGRERVSAED